MDRERSVRSTWRNVRSVKWKHLFRVRRIVSERQFEMFDLSTYWNVSFSRAPFFIDNFQWLLYVTGNSSSNVMINDSGTLESLLLYEDSMHSQRFTFYVIVRYCSLDEFDHLDASASSTVTVDSRSTLYSFALLTSSTSSNTDLLSLFFLIPC